MELILSATVADKMSKSLGGGVGGGKDEVDRPIVTLKFKLANHQRTVGVAARTPRQREGMEDKVRAVCDGATLIFFTPICCSVALRLYL